MLKILIEAFKASKGRMPNALEMILLKQKATKQALDQRKVLDMKGNPIDSNKPIIGGTQEFQSGIIKATKPKPNVVKTEAQIKKEIEKQNKESIQRLKDKMKDPEDFAGGGIAGMLGERTGYEEGRRVGRTARPKRKANPTDWYTDKIIADNLGRIKSDMFLKYILPERNKRFLENITEDETYGTYDEDGGYSGIVRGDFITKDGKRIEFPAPADKGIDVEVLLEFLDKPDEGSVSKYYNIEDRKPFDKRFYWDDDKGFVRGVELKGGGIAGMLGEPTYADDNHRVPYGKGKLVDAGRRLFLQAMGAGAAGVGAAKSGLLSIFKGGGKKQIVENLTQVPIHSAEGMPAWFKPLVNRVIKEGTETTKLAPNKGGAYLDRQIVHSAELGEGKGVRVYQNLDDQTIRVEYQSADNMGGIDDAVHLEYKAAEVLEGPIKKGKPTKTNPTFSAEEAFPHGTTGDYKDITMEGSNVVTKVDDLYSDTSALKQFGTNKTLSKKELEIAKQKRQRVNEINNDLGEQDQLLPDPPDYDDFASGGRVPFKFGGKGKVLEGIAKLMDEFFPGTTKLGKTSKPMAEKTQVRKAIADFQERENVIIDGKKYKRSDKDRPPTEEELEDDYAELWNDEQSPWDYGNTRREMDAALVEQKDYHDYMYQQYKMGKLDPEAGSVSRGRLELLRKRAAEAEDTKDFRLFGEDEADELDFLEDHFAQVDKEESFQFAERARKAKEEAIANKKSPWFKDPKTFTPEEELRREFPGISDDLISKILADKNPQRIAEIKASLHEALKMQQKGMGPDEIINIFKKKPTKHASGGRVSLSSGGVAGMLGE